MQAFTLRHDGDTVVVEDHIPASPAGVPVGTATVSVAAALVADGTPVQLERASVCSTATGPLVVAERRDDRRSKVKNALVLIEMSHVGFEYRCPLRDEVLTDLVRTRFLRREKLVAAPVCRTCGRGLVEGRHPALDALTPGVERDGVHVVSADENRTAALSVLRPGAALTLAGDAPAKVTWDGSTLSVAS